MSTDRAPTPGLPAVCGVRPDVWPGVVSDGSPGPRVSALSGDGLPGAGSRRTRSTGRGPRTIPLARSYAARRTGSPISSQARLTSIIRAIDAASGARSGW